jgi:hypothetical protein
MKILIYPKLQHNMVDIMIFHFKNENQFLDYFLKCEIYC